MKKVSVAALVMLSLLCGATEPPQQQQGFPEEGLPDAYYQRLKAQPKAFTFSRSFIALTSKVRENRAVLLQGKSDEKTLASIGTRGGLVVNGVKSVPVLLSLTSDSGPKPYNKEQLQQELFDGSAGTMTQFYYEMSYTQLTVNGTVYDWTQLPKSQSWYAGDDYKNASGTHHCFGLCPGSRIGEFIKDVLDRNPSIDWGQYDNDGPDRVPNSGDDDGYVDFVAFVHPGIGGECGGPNNKNIWSHRGQLVYVAPDDYTTQSPSANGGKIKINDYVIMPALACDGSKMIQIGVFAHEFGHAFGLPDLYDTTGQTQGGVGNWDLMASGSWGGDGVSPETPTHMSAWSKEFLGWVDPIPVTEDSVQQPIPDFETHNVVYKIVISPGRYYLVSNRERKRFDSKLPQSGLLIELINSTTVDAGLPNNKVNADPSDLGVRVVEADSKDELITPGGHNRGDSGDVFPGDSKNATFDKTTSPKALGIVSVCDVSAPSDTMRVTFLVKKNCPPRAQAAEAAH
jgi:M6 family metalloprotease-like protein